MSLGYPTPPPCLALALTLTREAVDAYDEAIARGGPDPQPHLSRADALCNSKRYEEALGSFARARVSEQQPAPIYHPTLPYPTRPPTHFTRSHALGAVRSAVRAAHAGARGAAVRLFGARPLGGARAGSGAAASGDQALRAGTRGGGCAAQPAVALQVG